MVIVSYQKKAYASDNHKPSFTIFVLKKNTVKQSETHQIGRVDDKDYNTSLHSS